MKSARATSATRIRSRIAGVVVKIRENRVVGVAPDDLPLFDVRGDRSASRDYPAAELRVAARDLAHESIEPKPSYINSRVDAFGNDVLYFSLESPHRSLQMVSETTVELTPRWASLDPATTPAWDEVAEGMRFSVGRGVSPGDGVLLCVAQYRAQAGLAGLCAGEFSGGHAARGGRDRSDAPDSCRLQVQAAWRRSYDTPAHRAFELKRGVCQDFAQVMIGCMRSLGLPARYVSGYLRNDPPPGQVEADRGGCFACVGFGVLPRQRVDRSRSDQ